MVYRSMKNGSRVADELYIKRVLIALEDFLFFSLYSFSCIASNSTTLEKRYLYSCPLDTYFEFSPATSISPASDPARYNLHHMGYLAYLLQRLTWQPTIALSTFDLTYHTSVI